MNNNTIIKKIYHAEDKKKQRLTQDCQHHATKQCNGDYWFNEDNNKWEGERAERGEYMEKSILKRLKELTGTKEIPDFITYQGDCRGYTLYMNDARMDEEEKKLCRELEFNKDWGGNYSIIKS